MSNTIFRTCTRNKRAKENQYLSPKNNWCNSFDSEPENQGGHVVVDFKYRLPITRRKFAYIPVKTLVIKSVDDMVANNKITPIKFKNKSGLLLYPNYWLSGVYYEDKDANESEDINDDEKNTH